MHPSSTPRSRWPARRAPWLALAASLALAGCARPAGPILDGADPAYRWPRPPDQARVQYLGQLRGDRDLKPGRGPGRGLAEALFGKDDAHAMLSPLAVCTDGRDRVFVADSNAQVVHVFDLISREYAMWRPPDEQGRFSQPVGIAWDPAGRLLVADSVAGVVFTFNEAGAFTGTLGAGALKRPCGIAVDARGGRLLVADVAAHQIVVLGPEGRELERLGERGSGPGEFNFPTNLAIDSRGRLYVSDSLNFRIQVFSPEFRFQRQIGRKGDMPGYFSQPKGVAIDQDDHLYVVDANFEAVQLFDQEGKLLMSFGREGHEPGEFWLPAAIHIDAMGRIFVADTYNKRVQVFRYLPEEPSP